LQLSVPQVPLFLQPLGEPSDEEQDAQLINEILKCKKVKIQLIQTY
jgi:hypothetical protein